MVNASEIIWLLEERTYGILVKLGAFFSTVRYVKDGTDFEVLIENDEFELWKEHILDYESDDE